MTKRGKAGAGRMGLAAALWVAVSSLAGTTAEAATRIEWWHAMTNANAALVESLAADFNDAQDVYQVVPVYKGTYAETLQAGLSAFAAGEPPAILQVFDVGTGVMMQAEGVVKPVAEVLEEGGYAFNASQYLPAVVSYYSRRDGTMLSFPFNSSSPVLYVNRTMLEEAGLDPSKPPRTWAELFAAARRVVASGVSDCGYTTTWPAWIHLENFAAWNDVPYGTRENGLAGTDVSLQIDAPIFVRHFEELAALAADGAFRYGGRNAEALKLFTTGECAMLTESSGGLGEIAQSKVEYGIGQLPYDETAEGAPQNTFPGGASLWVLNGRPEAEYKGVAEFFHYLSSTETQARLHQESGYLPVTMAAYETSMESGFYEENPGRRIAIMQMMRREPTANSRGVRLPNLPEVREIESEEIEALLAGRKTPAQALHDAAERGDAAIAAANVRAEAARP